MKTDAGYSIIDLAQKETIDLLYDKVEPLYGRFLLVLKKKEEKKHSYSLSSNSMINQYGVIDFTGAIIFEPDYYEITTLNEEPESDDEEEDDYYGEHSYEEDSPIWNTIDSYEESGSYTEYTES